MSSSSANASATPADAKPRGCFQCTKRRIICDLGHPTCGKCIKKGIECSGLGRFRFNDGVARRGKLKGCQLPTLDAPADADASVRRTGQAPLRIRWQGERRERPGNVSKRKGAAATSSNAKQSATAVTEIIRFDAQGIPLRFNTWTDPGPHGNRQVAGRRNGFVTFHNPSVQPWLAPLSPQVRMLFSHFSSAVAPVMVVLDRVSNGYRDFILPMACEDEVLRRAVEVVAAQHLCHEKRPDLQAAAEAGRAAVISRLRRDALQAPPERVFNVYTWATLIVLLVGETVTGSSEYGYLVQMLMCLSRNSNAGPGHSAQLGDFLKQQTHMFEFLAQPLLGEAAATSMIADPLQYLDWLSYELPSGSEVEVAISNTREAFLEASKLYFNRMRSEEDVQESLRNLRRLLAKIPHDAPCAHALVWVCFLGAVESTDEESRIDFTDRMARVYSKTGFRNIPAAIQSLEQIWARKDSSGRVTGLPEASPVLVM
ncbi:c6 zinc finger domain protein [Diplodia corticola]|uniref:C6 zinc finger domain protein n=1 Tax=Diplodia corticola TaxID=236234 RepID=A0A1J9S9U6_9PEZI|nr:c6 zinc finger domain protein [Diplodia corticola]OJD36357.1 c6 zinc finger domain protein [Diplodia corticola]